LAGRSGVGAQAVPSPEAGLRERRPQPARPGAAVIAADGRHPAHPSAGPTTRPRRPPGFDGDRALPPASGGHTLRSAVLQLCPRPGRRIGVGQGSKAGAALHTSRGPTRPHPDRSTRQLSPMCRAAAPICAAASLRLSWHATRCARRPPSDVIGRKGLYLPGPFRVGEPIAASIHSFQETARQQVLRFSDDRRSCTPTRKHVAATATAREVFCIRPGQHIQGIAGRPRGALAGWD